MDKTKHNLNGLIVSGSELIFICSEKQSYKIDGGK